jgi:hypothetical protein
MLNLWFWFVWLPQYLRFLYRSAKWDQQMRRDFGWLHTVRHYNREAMKKYGIAMAYDG